MQKGEFVIKYDLNKAENDVFTIYNDETTVFNLIYIHKRFNF